MGAIGITKIMGFGIITLCSMSIMQMGYPECIAARNARYARVDEPLTNTALAKFAVARRRNGTQPVIPRKARQGTAVDPSAKATETTDT